MNISKAKIQLAMARREMRVVDVAAEAGLTIQTIAKIMRKGKCKPVTLGKIAHALGVEPEDLLDEEGM